MQELTYDCELCNYRKKWFFFGFIYKYMKVKQATTYTSGFAFAASFSLVSLELINLKVILNITKIVHKFRSIFINYFAINL